FYHHKTFHPVSKPIESEAALDITKDLKNIAEQLEKLASPEILTATNISEPSKLIDRKNKVK
ncbi:hypothetical protein EAY83_25070, partial [Vibrio anguillarum]